MQVSYSNYYLRLWNQEKGFEEHNEEPRERDVLIGLTVIHSQLLSACCNQQTNYIK